MTKIPNFGAFLGQIMWFEPYAAEFLTKNSEMRRTVLAKTAAGANSENDTISFYAAEFLQKN